MRKAVNAAPPPGADARLIVGDEAQPDAACSLWWMWPPALGSHLVGRIGQYQAKDAEAGTMLLDFACRRLTLEGCTIAIGPMDGNTWHHYRLVTERGLEPPFFLEPDNPESYPEHFRTIAFKQLAHYSSALDKGLDVRDQRAPLVEPMLVRAGVTFRTIDMDRFEQEIDAIYDIALASFSSNFLFTPIGKPEFVAMYRPLREHIDPRLVHIAEQNGEVAGFVFALPDILRRQAGKPNDTMIVKTLARRRDPKYAGLGAVLLERSRRAAHDIGYTRCIHALMHDDNASTNLSEQFGETMRGYTLFARTLS